MQPDSFGNAGGGKSTLAGRAAKLMHLPPYPLDVIQHRVGGGQVPHDEFLKVHAVLLQRVRGGTIVRVLGIPDNACANLSPHETDDLKSMLGEAFPVDEIDQWGNARVTKWWDFPDGNSSGLVLALVPSNRELVDVPQGDA